MRKKIERFAEQMEIELSKNMDKTGDISNWKGVGDKLTDLEYHKAKLYFAIKENNNFPIKEYIADCANILFSIGDELELYEEDSINDGRVSQMKSGIFEIVPEKEQIRRKLVNL